MKKLFIVIAVIALVCAAGSVQAKDWKISPHRRGRRIPTVQLYDSRWQIGGF